MAGTAQPMGQTQIPTSPLATQTKGNYRPPINTLGQQVGGIQPATSPGQGWTQKGIDSANFSPLIDHTGNPVPGWQNSLPKVGDPITSTMPTMPSFGGEKIGAVNSVTGETIPIQPWQQEPGMITMYGGGGNVGRSDLNPEAFGGGLPVAPPPISALPKGGGGMYSGEQFAGLDMSGFNPRPQQTMDMSPYTLNGKTYHGSSSWASELQDYLNSTGQGDAFGRPEQNSLRQTSFSPSLTQRKF